MEERKSARRTAAAGAAPPASVEPPSDASRFEALATELSMQLGNASSQDIALQVDAALQRLVEALGYDRVTYAELGADGYLVVRWSAARAGVDPQPPGTFGQELQWFTSELRAGRVVALPDLPDGLPPEATNEAAYVRRIGLRAHLSIPLRIGGRVAGVLAFAAVRQAQAWPDSVIRRLTLIGELIAGASARARLEDEAQHLRSRLWHADRVARTGALTAAIAHEINQPLAAILGNAQAGLAYLQRGDASPERMRAILEAVVREDKRAADTIRSIRALLRHDDGGRAHIDLGVTIAEIVHLLASDLRRQGVRVHASLPEGCFVVAARVQIEQVALNVILNAAEAMQASPRSGRELRISVAPAADNRIRLAISDTGPGVAAEHREAIFEPFWTSRQEGLGLGLAICRSIVEAHDGVIAVEDNRDGGATFAVLLPAAAERPAEVNPPEIPAATAVPAVRGALVCIVDDDAAVREGLGRLLDAIGYASIAFASGPALLERWPIANVECLLLDLRLPGMSGLEIQARLAALGPVPPVVFMTGHGDAASGVDAMKQGAVDFLAKPVEHDVLVGVLRDAMARGAAEREQNAVRERCSQLVARLSPREREVTAHVIRGRLNKQIAADLGISEQTVKQHRGRVMEKLEVRSVADLVRIWEIAGSHHAPAAVSGIPPR
jgi:FixJ family two-component response regulator/signal transduction histidine kinase